MSADKTEASALHRFESLLTQALLAAKPIAHWGDGNGGYLLERFTMHMRAVGYLTDSPSRPQAKRRISAQVRRQVFERDKYRCRECESHIDLTLDHVVAESRGGSDDPSNLRTLCRSCNSKKGVGAMETDRQRVNG